MAKAQSFADKLKKKTGAHKLVCPECNGEIQRVKSVKSVPSSGGWKFNQRMIDVCKCNEKEVYASYSGAN